MNDPLITITADEFAERYDNFVHVDEVTAIAAERDAATALLSKIADTIEIDDHDALPDFVAGLVARVEAGRAEDVIDLREAVRLRRFAHRIQRAFATPGCEDEPLKIPYLGLLAERVAELVARVEADRAQVRQDVVDLQKAVRAYQTLDQIAVALGCPDQDHEDLPDSVEALRLQRDRLQAAAKGALGEVLRG